MIALLIAAIACMLVWGVVLIFISTSREGTNAQQQKFRRRGIALILVSAIGLVLIIWLKMTGPDPINQVLHGLRNGATCSRTICDL